MEKCLRDIVCLLYFFLSFFFDTRACWSYNALLNYILLYIQFFSIPYSLSLFLFHSSTKSIYNWISKKNADKVCFIIYLRWIKHKDFNYNYFFCLYFLTFWWFCVLWGLMERVMEVKKEFFKHLWLMKTCREVGGEMEYGLYKGRMVEWNINFLISQYFSFFCTFQECVKLWLLFFFFNIKLTN